LGFDLRVIAAISIRIGTVITGPFQAVIRNRLIEINVESNGVIASLLGWVSERRLGDPIGL
jgi:hypothetical protein